MWSADSGEISVSRPLLEALLPRAFPGPGTSLVVPQPPPRRPQRVCVCVCSPLPRRPQACEPPAGREPAPLFTAAATGGRAGGGARGRTASRGAASRGGSRRPLVCCCSWCCESGRRAAHPLTRLFHDTRVASYPSSPGEPRGTGATDAGMGWAGGRFVCKTVLSGSRVLVSTPLRITCRAGPSPPPVPHAPGVPGVGPPRQPWLGIPGLCASPRAQEP